MAQESLMDFWSTSNPNQGCGFAHVDHSLHECIYLHAVSFLMKEMAQVTLRVWKTRTRLYCLLTLQWRHNGHDGVSNHQPCDCLLNYLFSRRSKKTSKLRVPGLCAGNSPVTGEFPAQMASNAENVFIWWRHHEYHDHSYHGDTRTISEYSGFNTGRIVHIPYTPMVLHAHTVRQNILVQQYNVMDVRCQKFTSIVPLKVPVSFM